ncbi:dihydropteroate synthase [Hyphobacterium marinum]|uniref:dihydropteroate synthase n=1 Tax=Hyphobacterium marinum TaxID=3116574 RepID=A0ABU7LYP9_9PROT|nr:dihydropteroate synthase [Hyphobacterium sp. Y6023]MEE2566402.1 dihydropteroate synthase [Hyphobacterium sp. Y6023]
MGILNVTPDSFSDGGRYNDRERAVDHGLKLVSDGADMLDIGGESTRPGADPVDEAEEIRRTLPVIEALRRETGIPISIDTMKPGVARAAIGAGANIWNDVNALRVPGALETAAGLECGVVLMHMQGEPRTMQAAPAYDDVVAEVEACLLSRADAAIAAGIAPEKIALDPGIGFGKTLDHNLALLRGTNRLASHGFPVLVGASRKRFIAAADPCQDDGNRLGGSIYAALYAAAQGAAIVRVHDVRETAQAIALRLAIEG